MSGLNIGGFQLPRWVSLLLAMGVINDCLLRGQYRAGSFSSLLGDFPAYAADANRLLALLQGLPEGLTLDINLQDQFDRILGIANNFAGQLRLVTRTS